MWGSEGRSPGTSSRPHRDTRAVGQSPSLCASSARWWTSLSTRGLSTWTMFVRNHWTVVRGGRERERLTRRAVQRPRSPVEQPGGPWDWFCRQRRSRTLRILHCAGAPGHRSSRSLYPCCWLSRTDNCPDKRQNITIIQLKNWLEPASRDHSEGQGYIALHEYFTSQAFTSSTSGPNRKRCKEEVDYKHFILHWNLLELLVSTNPIPNKSLKKVSFFVDFPIFLIDQIKTMRPFSSK